MPRKLYDWKAVQALHDTGLGFVECSRRFGFTYQAWAKAIKRGAMHLAPSRFDDRRRAYDWGEIQAYYDTGASYRQCKAKFGFHAAAWSKAVKRGEMRPRNNTRTVAQVLMSRSSRRLKKLKLLREGYLRDRCSDCGISEWRGRRLVIQIDHINGVNDDWRLENLRMLCPNCHSQTETFSGRNLKRAAIARAQAGRVV
jgi:5-methylcytosine-specific restriction endonuclease McrA